MKKLACAMILALCVCATGCRAAQNDGEMTAVFFDVGKADAILLQTDEMAVLVDAGENKSGDEVVEALRERGVTHLDAMIVTHFDKDHVGGADKVLEGVEVERVFEPDYAKDSKQFRQYREALAQAGIEAQTLSENVAFELGGCSFSIDVANEDDYGADEENDFSLVVRVAFGQSSFLLAGDAENARLAELLDEGGLDCDVLKVPHHGGYEELSPAFFAACSPEYAVITSSADEPEDEATVYALETAGAQVLLTREGTVVLVSDGQSVRLRAGQ